MVKLCDTFSVTLCPSIVTDDKREVVLSEADPSGRSFTYLVALFGRRSF